ncbi:MAG: nucleoside-diphosphate sugar epimerase [Xanthomonadales bacterium]|nr:nucleoside-diphosphate sugar epimerase [Xanthomonadales bacterium]
MVDTGGWTERAAVPGWLVTGATGMVGRRLLARLAVAVPPVAILALARGDSPAWALTQPTVAWRRGDLFRDAIIDPVDTLLGAGPLDGLVACLARQPPPRLRRVVALSSTSAHSKRDSDDPDERALAMRLAEAEAALAAWCGAHGVHWTVLRPTLIHDGVDAGALGALVTLRKRFGVFLLPRGATGRRQPVHADAVAQAMLAAAASRAAADRAYDLPGAEVLRYDAMVARTLAVACGRARLLRVPDPVFAGLAQVAMRMPGLRALNPAMLARLRQDLVFDPAPAVRDFGYAPPAFSP